MSRDQRVLWSEGMFLSPHHFQQWDRSIDSALQFRIKSLSNFHWGLTELEINREGLENGQLSITRCSGVFPGGAIFRLSETDGRPLSRALRNAVDLSVQIVNVYLALPAGQQASRNIVEKEEPGLQLRRYIKEAISVFDEASGENEREIAVVRPNLQILLGEEALAGYDYLQVARLRQETGGAFVIDDTYIPPCLQITCSAVMMAIIRRLLDTLHSKSASLSESRSQRTVGMLEFSGSDLGNLFLLQAVNSAIPIVDHYCRMRLAHPESLFISLAQLAGALLMFSPSAQPKDLPFYDHNNLSGTFFGIEKSIQASLKVVVPTGAVEIALQRDSDSKFTAIIEDENLLVSAQVFLAVKADIPENQLIEELPRQTKISSIDSINSLLGLALPGVALIHSPIPPHPLRVKLGLQYFKLESRRDAESQKHWEHICKSRTLAIRVPGQRFPSLKMELWSIKE
jgi:type VI secretion system protein ImpJ